jgi:hypothetical protein
MLRRVASPMVSQPPSRMVLLRSKQWSAVIRYSSPLITMPKAEVQAEKSSR